VPLCVGSGGGDEGNRVRRHVTSPVLRLRFRRWCGPGLLERSKAQRRLNFVCSKTGLFSRSLGSHVSLAFVEHGKGQFDRCTEIEIVDLWV